jgi:sigma-B regulation protein RsbU (phosphoserine phosphatase)
MFFPEDKTLQREIGLAQKIQTRLLNGKTPKISRGEVVGTSLPARLVGGDYYDFYPLKNGKIRIIIGDVMGKGIPAAMLMILTRGAFRSAAVSTSGPGETLTAMNNALIDDFRSLSSFVTLFCADWNPHTGTLSHANAGHHQPLVIRGFDQQQEILCSEGVMIGALPNQTYKEEQTKLFTNDIVFFYTDGIIEAHNRKGDLYKLNRLKDELVQNNNKNVCEIKETVINSIHQFTEEAPQKDDITMVILKVKENHDVGISDQRQHDRGEVNEK